MKGTRRMVKNPIHRLNGKTIYIYIYSKSQNVCSTPKTSKNAKVSTAKPGKIRKEWKCCKKNARTWWPGFVCWTNAPKWQKPLGLAVSSRTESCHNWWNCDAIIVVLDIEGALLTHNISILIIINAGTCITGHQMTQSILSSASHCPTPRNQKTSPGAVCGEPKSKLAFLRAHGIALRAWFQHQKSDHRSLGPQRKKHRKKSECALGCYKEPCECRSMCRTWTDACFTENKKYLHLTEERNQLQLKISMYFCQTLRVGSFTPKPLAKDEVAAKCCKVQGLSGPVWARNVSHDIYVTRKANSSRSQWQFALQKPGPAFYTPSTPAIRTFKMCIYVESIGVYI